MRCPVCENDAAHLFQTVGPRAYWRCPTCSCTFLQPDQRPGPAAEQAEYRLHQNHPGDAGYRRHLQQLAAGDPDDELSFELVLDSFRHRSYGLFLLFVLIPVFIPIPAGQGAFSGLLTSLIGLQLMWHFEHPWVPKFIGRKTFKRTHVINFQRRFDPWLKWIEKLCKPRYEYAFDHAWARAFSGLLLLVLGILLALPIAAVIMVLVRHLRDVYKLSDLYGESKGDSAEPPNPA